jgi:predicted signal transduction protein with EAL and GGDEF domain
MGRINSGDTIKGFLLIFKDIFKKIFLNSYFLIVLCFVILYLVQVPMSVFLIILICSFVLLMFSGMDSDRLNLFITIAISLAIVGTALFTKTENINRVVKTKIYLPTGAKTLKYLDKTKSINKKRGVYSAILTYKNVKYLYQIDKVVRLKLVRLPSEDCSKKFKETKKVGNRIYEFSNDDVCPDQFKNNTFKIN